MADEKIKVEIESSYKDTEAKKAIADAKKIEDLKPEIEITADASGVTEGLDKVTTAGERVAAELADMASKAETELKGAAAAADALGTALGPEMTSRANIPSLIADLQKMGLTTEEIVADADKLAASLRQMDDVNLKAIDSGLAPAVPTLDKLSEGAQKSRNALANMVGNSAQDLGALGGVAGSAGVALGQLAEGAADAGSLKDALTGAVPAMAGLAIGTAVLQRGMQNYAKDAENAKKATEAHTKEVDSFTKAITSGGNEVEAYVAHLKDLGGIHLAIKNLSHVLGDSVIDMSGVFAEAGISADQYAKAVTGSEEDMTRFNAAVKDMNLSTSAEKAILQTAKSAHEDHGKAVENGARFNKLFAESSNAGTQATGEFAKRMSDTTSAADAQAKRMEEEAKAIDEATKASEAASTETDRLTTALEGSAQAAEDSAKQHQDNASALSAEVDAMFGMGDASIAAEKAEENFAEAAKNTTEAIKKHGKGSEEATKATEDERDAAISAAKAQAALAKQHDEAAGATQSNTAKVDTMNQALLNQAAFATPAARDAISDYITEANNVPPDKVTDIKAAIARGDFDEAKRLLDEASAARSAAIIADAETTQAKKDLDEAAKTRIAKIIVQAIGTGVALGLLPNSTPTAGGTSASGTSVSGTAVAAAPTNVIVNLPTGSRGIDALREVTGQVRRSGTRYGSAVPARAAR